MSVQRQRLEKLLKAMALTGALCVVIVLFDFSFDRFTPERSYHFELPSLSAGEATLLKSGQMLLVVSIPKPGYTTDTGSYFVSLGYGSLMHCPLVMQADGFSESCSDARYDLLGRSLEPQKYEDLKPVSYRLSRDNKYLIID